ncbi:GNAT family N-acetyltransferase [Planobispora takensis]|uniref:N-acetyltransferase domain-containing protein n=1 Tax=Planobispora takensis TaxID=1367882 RepID=A0A8J3T734_9ACTN|nr:GNAT family N-acetyltransferase [Planobispora takensis]GII05313.1 hypothetical protein Pta02_73210 [Planobispora takensis]
MTIELRAVAEDDLPFLGRLTDDPDGAGVHQWYGWHDPHRHRRRWEENGLLGADGGVLLVVRGSERAGFVSWSKAIITRAGHCWEIGLILAPEFRGRGYGRRRNSSWCGICSTIRRCTASRPEPRSPTWPNSGR